MPDAQRRRPVRIADLGRIVTGRTPPSAHPGAFGGAVPFITPSDIDGLSRTIQTERHYLLRTLQPALRRRAGGAATPIVNKAAFAELTVHVPPLAEQRQISEILRDHDDLIENSLRRIAVLEAMIRALHGEHNRSHQPGWTTTELGHLVDEIRATVDPRTQGPNTPYLGLEHLPRRSIAIHRWGTARAVQSAKIQATRGDLLFGKIRPYFHKAGVCPVDAVCSSDILVLRPRQPEHFALALTCIASDPFVAHATHTSQGTRMPRASWPVLRRFPVATPPPELLAAFNTRVREATELIHQLGRTISNLRATRDLLLPKLLAGELPVPRESPNSAAISRPPPATPHQTTPPLPDGVP